MIREHQCNGTWSTASTWWLLDANGIELCRACAKCRAEKLAQYKPWVLSGYDQGDLDEPIEDELRWETHK